MNEGICHRLYVRMANRRRVPEVVLPADAAHKDSLLCNR
jgi:hypothetical protein